MTDEMKRKLLSLVEKWRADGEHWYGTPSDAAFNICADQLLAALGMTDDDPRLSRQEVVETLASMGIDFSTLDPRAHWTSSVFFLIEDERLRKLDKMAERLCTNEEVSDTEIVSLMREQWGENPALAALVDEIVDSRHQINGLKQSLKAVQEQIQRREASEGQEFYDAVLALIEAVERHIRYSQHRAPVHDLQVHLQRLKEVKPSVKDAGAVEENRRLRKALEDIACLTSEGRELMPASEVFDAVGQILRKVSKAGQS